MTERLLSADIRSTVLNTMATFLEDFANAIAVGNRPLAAVAAAKVSQLGLSVFEFFAAGCESICTTAEETRSCHEAVIVVRNLMEKNLDAWYQTSLGEKERARLELN